MYFIPVHDTLICDGIQLVGRSKANKMLEWRYYNVDGDQ